MFFQGKLEEASCILHGHKYICYTQWKGKVLSEMQSFSSDIHFCEYEIVLTFINLNQYHSSVQGVLPKNVKYFVWFLENILMILNFYFLSCVFKYTVVNNANVNWKKLLGT